MRFEIGLAARLVFNLAAERFSAFELTDEREGERFDRVAVVSGEIRIGDRAYLQPDRMLTARMEAIGDAMAIRRETVEIPSQPSRRGWEQPTSCAKD